MVPSSWFWVLKAGLIAVFFFIFHFLLIWHQFSYWFWGSKVHSTCNLHTTALTFPFKYRCKSQTDQKLHVCEVSGEVVRSGWISQQNMKLSVHYCCRSDGEEKSPEQSHAAEVLHELSDYGIFTGLQSHGRLNRRWLRDTQKRVTALQRLRMGRCQPGVKMWVPLIFNLYCLFFEFAFTCLYFFIILSFSGKRELNEADDIKYITRWQ